MYVNRCILRIACTPEVAYSGVCVESYCTVLVELSLAEPIFMSIG